MIKQHIYWYSRFYLSDTVIFCCLTPSFRPFFVLPIPEFAVSRQHWFKIEIMNFKHIINANFVCKSWILCWKNYSQFISLLPFSLYLKVNSKPFTILLYCISKDEKSYFESNFWNLFKNEVVICTINFSSLLFGLYWFRSLFHCVIAELKEWGTRWYFIHKTFVLLNFLDLYVLVYC